MITRNQAKVVKVSHKSKGSFKDGSKVESKRQSIKQQRYYKQFDFFFTRTCFRYMNEYYKERYQEFSDKMHLQPNKSLSQMTKEEMDSNLRAFMSHLFGPEIFSTKSLSAEQKQQLVHSMMIFVFAHRHNKGDRFIVETQ